MFWNARFPFYWVNLHPQFEHVVFFTGKRWGKNGPIADSGGCQGHAWHCAVPAGAEMQVKGVRTALHTMPTAECNWRIQWGRFNLHFCIFFVFFIFWSWPQDFFFLSLLHNTILEKDKLKHRVISYFFRGMNMTIDGTVSFVSNFCKVYVIIIKFLCIFPFSIFFALFPVFFFLSVCI